MLQLEIKGMKSFSAQVEFDIQNYISREKQEETNK